MDVAMDAQRLQIDGARPHVGMDAQPHRASRRAAMCAPLLHYSYTMMQGLAADADNADNFMIHVLRTRYEEGHSPPVRRPYDN